MDAPSASPEVQTDFNVCSFLLQIQNSSFPTTLRSNNTVVKYTKLPEFDFDSKALWPQKNSYVLQPRLRRIVALNDQDNIMRTSRSLRSELGGPIKLMSSTFAKRKIVTISEDEEKDLLPAYSKTDEKKVEQKSKSNRAVGSDVRYEPIRTRPLSASSRNSKKQDTKLSAKPVPLNNTSKTLNSSRTFCKSKNTLPMQENKSRIIQDRDNTRYSRNLSVRNKISLSKNLAQPSVSDKEICLIKNKLSDKKFRPFGELNKQSDRVSNSMKELKIKNKSPVIHVPYDRGQKQEIIETEITHITLQPVTFANIELKKIDGNSSMERNVHVRDMNVGTDPEPAKVDVVTEIEIEAIQKTDTNIQTDFIQNSCYDNLEIPNVTLSKDKSDISKDGNSLSSQSLPNLQVPSLKITPRKEDKSNARNLSQKPSYIIGRATVTYTTRQKIDFHVVDGNDKSIPNQSSRLSYPLNVVSVLKKGLDNPPIETEIQKKKDKKKSGINSLNEIYSPYAFDSTKLMKPSEIISTIRVNSGLLKSDYICEQFQRELDFIDSFFESLQYLESCSLSEKCFASKKVENWVSKSGFDIKNPEYDLLFSNLENGTNIDDTETMASKSLCLLNLLIRDEQKRAKNLLFVLKMREDALKDFTKSQILWLENKKKQDNIDIPTLKKKQRGALLKLQHECGEMQRMRKALLTLSEKRKVALMKAKKNIELKLKNNVTVNHILLGKKKLKRNAINDRSTAPLKCFELSSSGCEESTTPSRAKSDSILLVPELLPLETNVRSLEKSIQTGDSLMGTTVVDQTTDTAAENYITVDGGYLNILFSNLSLPEIFSSGKHYEVNEEALRTTVNSANSRHNADSESDIVEKFIVQIKNREQDRSSTPSTARSLVEEFDQYYKGFADEEKSPAPTPERKNKESADVINKLLTNTDTREINSISSGTLITEISATETQKTDDMYANNKDLIDVSENSMNSVNTQVLKGKDSITIATQAGPLPVPAGAVATLEPPIISALVAPIVSISNTSTSNLSDESVVSVSSLSSQAAPAHSEAEELRRQQLAIEREIKALEQQQCQLLVVREIPDKPPPPYTPPAESRVLKLPRMFVADETIEEKVHRNLSDSIAVSIEPTDAFDIFLQDFCQESVVKHKAEQSDKPWDACNLLPHKPPLAADQLALRTAAEARDVLTGVSPTTVSGVSARRSDHIDDILFAEWRRCEPEWTALHVDEACVKTQIFEGIFQRILTETIDQYKKTVLTPNDN